MTASIPLQDRLAVSVPEAGELVGLSSPAVRRLVDQGVLARVPHTDRVLIARAELDRWVTSTMPRHDDAA